MFEMVDGILGTSPDKLQQLASKARERITERYHISKREKAFLDLIAER